ncbi:probable RRB1 protein, involved in the regulation of ribosome biosynthesis [Phialocephala subalpina]|uniref:Probable RRB1 protein, involved in the regulation of ribosome biosynthesis n=1 Tax=Phialocephala subalpina TaxID=576137 RepID=A0A1L7WPK4_9HELO|nr:probable RRB1 protein, involved in the regulation of ribosome biosynthesis [Phialocephala subalpina]
MSDDEDFDVEVPELEGDFAAFAPQAFGKKSKEADVAAQIGRTKRATDAPQQKIAQEPASKDDDSEDDDDDDSDDQSDDDEFPVSHELVLKTHERAVTTVSLDPSGGRLVTGSTDCTLKLHDFASMTPTTLRAFKTVDPSASKTAANSETHPISHVEFNPLSGGTFLCVSAHPQAKIMNRDGDVLAEFVKGDMYLRDMNNTKGHVSEVTTGTWNPVDKNICVTAGTDSTLRIWDVNHKREQKSVIVHKSRAAGSAGRTRMTAVAWGSPLQGGPNVLVAAALDGSLVMWSGDGPFARPAAEIREAHKPNTWTGGIDISADGRMVVTRGGDDLIKLWDTRKFKAPVVTVSHPSTSDHYAMTNIKYSPTSSSIITGSVSGHLHILNPGNLKPELVTPVTPGSPLITVAWHPKLNQIVTGSANAEVHVLYNPNTSVRGAVDVMSRAPKKRHVDDDPNFTTDQSTGISGDSIVTPGGILTNTSGTSYSARHPTVGLTASGRSRDPRRPQIPMVTPFMKSQPDEGHINQSIPLSSMRDEDPREALLKYDELAKKDPIFTNAWKETQPVTQYRDLSDEEDEEGPDKKRLKR